MFELYQAGRLAEIREYNLNDVRVTRKVFERLVACFGQIIRRLRQIEVSTGSGSDRVIADRPNLVVAIPGRYRSRY